MEGREVTLSEMLDFREKKAMLHAKHRQIRYISGCGLKCNGA